MTKVDFKKTLKHLYAPGKKAFELIEVPAMQFLMVDGHGDPNTAATYQQAVEALYAMAYKIKFISKKKYDKDYTVPPLEGLWWADDMRSFVSRAKSEWDWTMMIMTPDWISTETFTQAVHEVRKSKDPAALDLVRLETYDEGLSAQIMHLGSYDDEGPTIARLHNEFLPDNGLVENGKHHEIYLSDPRRTAPEKLKTILRQPVREMK
jgi:hypothetical protein